MTTGDQFHTQVADSFFYIWKQTGRSGNIHLVGKWIFQMFINVSKVIRLPDCQIMSYMSIQIDRMVVDKLSRHQHMFQTYNKLFCGTRSAQRELDMFMSLSI